MTDLMELRGDIGEILLQFGRKRLTNHKIRQEYASQILALIQPSFDALKQENEALRKELKNTEEVVKFWKSKYPAKGIRKS